jgi:hypothetical protein
LLVANSRSIFPPFFQHPFQFLLLILGVISVIVIFGSLSKSRKFCLQPSLISVVSLMFIIVQSLQAVVYGLNSFLLPFTIRYILLLSFCPCSFLLVSFVFEAFLIFLSMPSFIHFYHFFISFLCLSNLSIILL